jgi:hypothetical protein
VDITVDQINCCAVGGTLLSAVLLITIVAITKRPTSAGRAIFQVISIYMVCPPVSGRLLVDPRIITRS